MNDDVPSGYSTRLYNDDLAPRKGPGTWKTGNLFNWWMSAWHSLADYTAAVSLLALGLLGWQLAFALCLGVVVIYLISNLAGVAGQKIGVPFPVFARISFGVFGANIPALLRAIVAVAWYGIQTYLASQVILVLAVKTIPSAESLLGPSFLGLSALGWISFLLLWSAQLFVLHRGMESIRRLSDFAGPAIWVAMIALTIWTLHRAEWTIDWSYHVGSVPLGAGDTVIQILAAASLIVALLSGPVLNFSDFTRLASSRRSVIRGNQLGLLVNGIAFCLVSVVITLASVRVYGKAINDPIILISEIDNITVLLLAILAVGISTAGINIILNFVSPAFDFANIAPRHIDFKKGGLITAILSVVILPWNLYSNPVVISVFLGGIGALMGPLFGIMMADYYLIRRGRVTIAHLYTEDPSGKYFYTRGFNKNSVAALIISGIATLAIAFIPAMHALAPFTWPLGTTLGAIVCLAINRLRPNTPDNITETPATALQPTKTQTTL
ncbi:NCS1 family nucleobase:cation symporter-1 (plasmid) [Paenarthrobacter ureafaciens]|nr:NCS1 family nucleobase:cation symporter-1 [Paenarthrobacter ureafaciens]